MRLLLAPIAVLLLGCSYVGQSASPAPTNPPTPTAAATASPAPPAAPTPTPSAPPTSAPPTLSPNEPPAGMLASDIDRVAGWLGTYCWGDTCRDTLQTAPKSTLPELSAPPNSQLTFALADGSVFHEWHASFAATSNGGVTTLGEGGAGVDPDSTASPPPEFRELSFPVPPQGDWVVYVSIYVTAGDAGGDASYAWHVIVP